MRLLVLYSELAGYFTSCIDVLHQRYGADILLIHWKVNEQAPFQFSFGEGLLRFEKTQFKSKQALLSQCVEFRPDIVLVSGWIDKDYLSVARTFRQRGLPVVLASDTQWKGSPRQYVVSLLGGRYIRHIFSHAWVTGVDQYEYARRLGFGKDQIRMGVYSANQPLFHNAYLANRDKKVHAYPRQFIYVGRFAPEKDVKGLYQAFSSIPVAQRNGWSLQLIGTGPLASALLPAEGIRIVPFTQPDSLPALLAESGCFVLPSLREPWGVVVHECGAAGLPLLLSDAVGASSTFLHEGYNGYRFKSGDTESLLAAMHKIIQADPNELVAMGDRSATLSFMNTPDIWAYTLRSMMNKNSGF
jgi:glycosyltransferase involved in cell wall biosynthesis